MRPKAERAIDSEGERNNCFSQIQLVAQNQTRVSDLEPIFLVAYIHDENLPNRGFRNSFADKMIKLSVHKMDLT